MGALHLAAFLAAPGALAAGPDKGRLHFSRPAPAPDGGVPLDAARVGEARSTVPPLLRYGAFRPEPGRWVEYDVVQPGGDTHVERLSLVGATDTERGPLYQLELDVAIQPHVLVVMWVVGGPSPELDRLAVTLNAGDPVSVPVDLPLDHPALRGTPLGSAPGPAATGPFAGPTRVETWEEPTPVGKVVARTSPAVPLLGLHSLQHERTRWTVRATGKGATPGLRSVPLNIPRLGGSPER